MDAHPPFLSAGNAGPFTLDGTRTYRVGRRSAVVLDPGPDVEDHVRALVVWLADAGDVRVVVTHGHRDHAGAAPRLARALGVAVMGPGGLSTVESPLADGDALVTDEGTLRAVDTPGHAEHHLCFHWEERGAMFAGDLLLGRGDTTGVAEYPGCVADYLESLERVRGLDASVIYPAHGDPITDVPGALGRYEKHRRERIRQVREALAEAPGATPDELLRRVYPTAMPSALERAAKMSLAALLEHVRSGAGP
ncbi:MAG TPA: MBL fold metallo-hydrolase [Longimicrobiales bacterium]|nr:MBL fold metallo-hydrolase [Longimicrobiales bacterium]